MTTDSRSSVTIDIGDWQIRSFAADDAAALCKYANNRNIWVNLRDRFPYPYRHADAISWLERVHAQPVRTHFAIATPEELIGAVGFEVQEDVYRRSAEIGYWVAEPYWGRGIATRAVGALTAFAFARHDLVRTFAGVFSSNPASARVLEKAGYTFEGRLRRSVVKDGIVLDQLVYAMVRP
jgi:RimJ/RimL family protein N-acetyltransferase